MELISAVKMRKAVDKVLAMRPYAQASVEILNNMAQNLKRNQHPLLEKRPEDKTLALLISSNKGLCGAYNSEIKRTLDNLGNKNLKDFILIGKKGEIIVKKLNGTICHPDHLPTGQAGSGSLDQNIYKANTINDISELSKTILEEFKNKKYDKVIIIYTDYINSIKQNVVVRQLLPMSMDDLSDEIREMNTDQGHKIQDTRIQKKKPETNSKDNVIQNNSLNNTSPYLIEPEEQEVLDVILPRLIEIQIFHEILEARASEEASRLMAMKSATDTAEDMTEDLQLQYNRQRQAKITQEIAEISSS